MTRTDVPMSSLDKPLDKGIADAIADELTSGSVYVLDRRDLARQAALAGLREMANVATRIVAEMAADHERRGYPAGAKALRKAVMQIGTLPDNLR